jgi:hypothetical protein
MENVINNFYTNFNKLKPEEMVKNYHKDVTFEDPGFGVLHGEHAKNMWRMLCENATNFRIDFSGIEIKNNKGYAHWEAHYTFSKTGKKVHNIIDAEFEFKDGLIIKHTDTFDLHKWARQALGFKGLLFGGTSFFKKKLNQQTNHLLSKFESKQHEK